MESDNLGGLTSADGVQTVAGSSPESATQQTQDPIKNVKAEMNRKFSKLSQQIEQLVAAVSQPKVQTPADEADEDAPEYKRYVDARFQQEKHVEAKVNHERDFKEALQVFPELNQESDTFDPEFYKAVDSYYTKLVKADPSDTNALKDAIELVATRTGKNERLIQDKLLRDEARRSRIISEGGSNPKDNKKSKEPSVHEQNLARLGITGKKLDRLKTEMKKLQETN